MKKVLKKSKSEIIEQEKPVIFKEENPVYFKLGHEECIDSKRDLLISELSFLTVLKIMKKYNLWRAEELKIKSEMFKKMKELDASIQKTKVAFPFLQIPEKIRRKEVIQMKPIEEEKPAEESFDENLESQLREIQARLNSIGR